MNQPVVYFLKKILLGGVWGMYSQIWPFKLIARLDAKSKMINHSDGYRVICCKPSIIGILCYSWMANEN